MVQMKIPPERLEVVESLENALYYQQQNLVWEVNS